MNEFLNRWVRTGQKLVVYLVEDVRLFTYLVGFPVLVIAFGLAYWLLSPYNNGLIPGQSTSSGVTLADGLYFSIVTVSSLGYGDLRPVGLARLLACAEVFCGLSFMGIVVAKITSQRLSHHVRRLFSSDAQRRLDEFASSFERLDENLRRTMKVLGEAYQPTPDQEGGDASEKKNAQSSFEHTLAAFRQNSGGLRDYLESETQQGGYFEIVPNTAVERLGNSIDKGMMVLTQLIISLSPEARTDVLDGPSRQGMADIVAAQQRICGLVRQYCRDSQLRECFSRILQTCKHFPESYYIVPQIPSLTDQPDQLPERADEPEVLE